MSEKIKLSFLELSDNNFEIPIYRKAWDNNNSKANGFSRYNLPTTVSGKDRDFYAVSFQPNEDCIQFNCRLSDNRDLTKKWLITSLIQSAEKNLSNDKFFVGKHFIPCISFVIAAHKSGYELIQVEPYYLEANNSFGFIMDYKFRANKGFEKSREEKILSLSINNDGSKNRNFYSDKLKKITESIQNVISKVFPINLPNLIIDVKRNLTDVSSFLLEEKIYEFKNGQSSVQFQGLIEHKPLNGIDGSPLFVFIFEKSKINTARELIKALRGQLYSTFSGMENVFDVKFANENITSIIVDDFSKKSLADIEAQLNSIISENVNSKLVGVFVGIEKDFDTDNDYSPYYSVKSFFLKNGLAVQAITIEQALKKDGYKWSIASIALQLFVKIGGQPWKVKPQNENCLIFGISNAHVKEFDKITHRDKITKYFAYSLCFDSSGLYRRLSVIGNSNDEKTYIQQLSEQITQNLNAELTNKITKCVIHVPFKLKKDEITCIKDSIDKVKAIHQNIEFVVIKININNKFFGYSEYNSRIPLAGSCLQLGKKEFLIWFEGLQQGKTQIVSPQNITNPVHIHFWDCPSELDDNEIKSYIQDIINLSGANWRGFNAKHEPVTTLYPELIARFAGKFEQYGLNMTIGNTAMDKVWFI